jgi:hypothetical protein
MFLSSQLLCLPFSFVSCPPVLFNMVTISQMWELST